MSKPKPQERYWAVIDKNGIYQAYLYMTRREALADVKDNPRLKMCHDARFVVEHVDLVKVKKS